ncbi:MAG: hypothetical protein LBU67_07370 [Oscillospiraceae bacterium]|jgi:alpha-galactosidase|nr:hypothetical protein [Oscillospiraceae bacterium]
MATTGLKFAIIGAGSVSFCPATLCDILLSEPIGRVPLSIALMDIDAEALAVSEGFARQAVRQSGRMVNLAATTVLQEALEGADFVITAIEVDRYRYWAMDFHIPRRYGFRQVYGENGGPGGMFHTLRNLPPMLHIARTMQRVCPDAWLLNYTNPEAKLVEAIARLTKVKVVGLCHGEGMGRDQLAQILGMPKDQLATDVVGLNHFGWFARVARADTGEDLYPLLREREAQVDPLAHWDELALPRLMLRTYGLYPYPGANHIGEYLAWGDELLASAKLQFYFDPAQTNPWGGGKTPEFVYGLADHPTDRPLFPAQGQSDRANFLARFTLRPGGMAASGEYGIPIAEAIAFDMPRQIGAVNVPNIGYAPNLPQGMVIELPALADGAGIHPKPCAELPVAVASMIQTQGAIHRLLIEAYEQQSRRKLLQAMLLDPTVSGYQNAVALINEMCDRQAEILPPLYW